MENAAQNDLFSQENMITVLVIVLTIGLIRFMPRLTAGVPFVKPAEVKKVMDSEAEVVVVDVRTEGEFTGSLGHIPGSINLPLGDIDARLKVLAADLEPLKNEKLFVTCRTENRAPRAAKAFKKAGFTNVSIVAGGVAGWNRAKLPVEGKS